MLITVDLTHPDNDLDLVGLAAGESPETRFGPRGYIAYRLFSAAARLLFLTLQKNDKPDIAAATAVQIDREAEFVQARLQDLTGGGPRRNGGRRR